MKKKLITAVVLGITALGASSYAFAGSIEAGGFGNSTMKEVTPVAKKAGECVSFEASFSEPLDKSPSAMLDIEQNFVNMYNKFLEVTKISDKKYRLSLTASTAEGCPKIEDQSRLTISTYSGSEAQDQRQTLPESITFKAEKADKKMVFKKE